MIDFHCHILPAIDDGAVSIDDSIAMAKSLSDFGYKTVCCTPHCIKGYYDITPQKVREATLMLQADLDNADIHLELWPGMEYMLDEYFSEHIDDLLPLGETKLVLCEATPQAHPEYVLEGLKLILEKGFVPLIAHPERTQFFYEMLSQHEACGELREKTEEQSKTVFEGSKTPLSFFKKMFAPRDTRSSKQDFYLVAPHATRNTLREACLFQANQGSFSGFYGHEVQKRAYALLKLNVYTAIASDLHDSRSAQDVLVRDKLTLNPLLSELTEFDGTKPSETPVVASGEQGRLFE